MFSWLLSLSWPTATTLLATIEYWCPPVWVAPCRQVRRRFRSFRALSALPGSFCVQKFRFWFLSGSLKQLFTGLLNLFFSLQAHKEWWWCGVRSFGIVSTIDFVYWILWIRDCVPTLRSCNRSWAIWDIPGKYNDVHFWVLVSCICERVKISKLEPQAPRPVGHRIKSGFSLFDMELFVMFNCLHDKRDIPPLYLVFCPTIKAWSHMPSWIDSEVLFLRLVCEVLFLNTSCFWGIRRIKYFWTGLTLCAMAWIHHLTWPSMLILTKPDTLL